MEHEGMGYGAASLENALKGIRFPISKKDLLACFGENQVWISPNQAISVRQALAGCPHDDYGSLDDILSCEPVSRQLKGMKAA